MKTQSDARLLGIALTLFFSFVALACEDKRVINPVLPPTAQKACTALTGSIDGIRTLSPDTIYVLIGVTYVQPNAELIIPAGTRIEGDFETKGLLVTVRGDSSSRSGRIYALGTRENPIVFTSSRSDGEKQRGDWCGITLNGLGTTNQPLTIWNTKGRAKLWFGGTQPSDTSGVFRYVRIEFAGGICPDGQGPSGSLEMRGVGNGTLIEFVQAHHALGDGFRFIGGNCNAKYLLATGCGNDAFDFDYAFNGKLQFLIGVQDRALADRGIESDNFLGNQTIRSRFPVNSLTSPIVFNTTLIGAGVQNANNEINDALYLRSNTQGFYANQLVVNFGAFGSVVAGAFTIEQFQHDSLVIRNSIFANRGLQGLGNSAGVGVGSNVWGAFFRDSAIGYDTVDAVTGMNFFSKSENREIRAFESAEGLIQNVNYNNPINGIKPDLRLAPNSPARNGFMTPSDPTPRYSGDVVNFFSPANFIGAMDDVDWTEGWTNWTLDSSP
jgi:hypothetical protein